MKTASLAVVLLVASFSEAACNNPQQELERPERVRSIRQAMYDSATYVKLSQLWKNYYDAYPSEESYANWMYATRHALSDNYGKERENYKAMLNTGLEQYPGSPVLLYLLGSEKLMSEDRQEGIQLLEESAALDPEYSDPWFSLVVAYLADGDRERRDVALRSLLEGRAVEDEVIDFCYNMISSVDSNAILITHGDNDTFPGWILTRIIGFRSDVNVVNRSLLNASWYASTVMKDGVPPFITQAGMDSLRKVADAGMTEARKKNIPFRDVGIYGDRLIVKIIEAGERTGRPVYFACTLESSGFLDRYVDGGRKLGLVTLVSATSKPYDLHLRNLFRTWTNDFRTGGLDSWQIRFSKESRSGRILSRNYATALLSLNKEIRAAGNDVRLSLFTWYRMHLMNLIPAELADRVNAMWCNEGGPREIEEWCMKQGIRR